MNLHSLNVLIGSLAILVLLSGSRATRRTDPRRIWLAQHKLCADLGRRRSAVISENGINREVLYLESALVRTGLIAGDTS